MKRQVVVWGWVYGFLAALSLNRFDPDFGWHYRLGEYILARGIPYRDVLSYTAAGQPWVDHEWLSNVVMYILGNWGGYQMLALVWAGMWTLALGLGVRWRLHWLTAGLALAALSAYAGVRSTVWTVLGTAVMLVLLEKRQYAWTPVLMLVWANAHGGFAVGLVLIALKLIIDRDWRLMKWLVLSAGATLVNPYGWGLYGELWQQMSDRNLAFYVSEWMPLKPGLAVAPYLVLAAALLVMRKGVDYARVTSAGFLLAAVWSMRHVPLLVAASLGTVNAGIGAGLAELEGRLRPGRWRAAVAALGVAAGVLLPLAVLAVPPRVRVATVADQPWPAIRELQERPCRGRVFNEYGYGGLIDWALPGVPVYIDGRMPSWNGPGGRYLDRYLQVFQGGEAMQREFARYSVQCVLIGEDDSGLKRALAADDHWRIAARGRGAELWRRD